MIVSEGVREMPAPHSPEFRRRALDLVAQGEPVARTARELGMSESCLRNWMKRDAIDSGAKPGLTTDERKELVEARRRIRVAVARFRGVRLGQLLYAGDSVAGAEWQERGWSKASDIRSTLFEAAAAAASRLDLRDRRHAEPDE
jgi:transposase-like protein